MIFRISLVCRAALPKQLVALFLSVLPVFVMSQTFTTLSGAANPMSGIEATLNTSATPFVTGDFTGDGFRDLVGRNTGNTGLVFWKNNGNGTWTQLTGTNNPFRNITITATNDFTVTSLAVLDADGDNDIDIYNRSLNILLRNDNGLFASISGAANPMNGIQASLANTGSAFVTGDFNGDGRTDLVGRNTMNNALVFWRNNGNNTWTQLTGASNPFNAISVTTSNDFTATSLGVLDADGDGDLDIYNRSLNTLIRNNAGTFASLSGAANGMNAIQATMPNTGSVFVTGDFTGDGFGDLVGRNAANTGLVFWKNNSNGSWSQLTGASNPFASVVLASSGDFSSGFQALLDVDGDQDTDIYNGNVNVVYQRVGSPTLPLVWIDFSARKHGSGVQLTWETASEVNTDHFVIERAADGRTFLPIGSALANPGSSAHAYSFVDKEKRTASCYYRIKQVDVDGKSTYSKILVIREDVSVGFRVDAVTLSSKGTISLRVEAVQQQPISILLLDLGGRQISRQARMVEKGSAAIKIPVNRWLPGGIYIVQVQHAGGTVQKKLVIQN